MKFYKTKGIEVNIPIHYELLCSDGITRTFTRVKTETIPGEIAIQDDITYFGFTLQEIWPSPDIPSTEKPIPGKHYTYKNDYDKESFMLTPEASNGWFKHKGLTYISIKKGWNSTWDTKHKTVLNNIKLLDKKNRYHDKSDEVLDKLSWMKPN